MRAQKCKEQETTVEISSKNLQCPRSPLSISEFLIKYGYRYSKIDVLAFHDVPVDGNNTFAHIEIQQLTRPVK